MIHVYPIGDTKSHVLDGTGCWCNPRVEFSSDCETLVIHNSQDGREVVEWAEDLLGNQIKESGGAS